jgi:hypothetical protein
MARPAMYMTAKTTDFRSIDLAWLRRKGARHPGYSGTVRWSRNGHVTGSIGYHIESEGLRLRYRTTPRGGEPGDVDELVPITTTAMHLGGVRHWFVCPSCWRRCRILYGGRYFRCRLCRGARYESQYQHGALTVCDMRWRIRERLEERGGLDYRLFGLDDGIGPKPPRMHWKTYRRLEARDEALAGRWRIGIGGWLERTQRIAARRVR